MAYVPLGVGLVQELAAEENEGVLRGLAEGVAAVGDDEVEENAELEVLVVLVELEDLLEVEVLLLEDLQNFVGVLYDLVS